MMSFLLYYDVAMESSHHSGVLLCRSRRSGLKQCPSNAPCDAVVLLLASLESSHHQGVVLCCVVLCCVVLE